MRARSIGTLLCCAVLAGLVLAVAALPVTALVGLAAKATADAYLDLPSQLATPTPPQTTTVYANDGKTLLTTFYDENRHDVTLADVAPVMQQAIVAAEDTRFYEHGGVDLRGILRAMVSDAHSGEAAQGASTLTMQYVRNVLQSDPGLTRRRSGPTRRRTPPSASFARCGTRSAWRRSCPKRTFCERYLNIAYFGDGAYGIYAASQAYFGKPASELTLPEAALLAGTGTVARLEQPDQRGCRRRGRPARVRARRDGEDGSDQRRRRGHRAGHPDGAAPSPAAQRLHLDRAGAQRLGLLLRLLPAVVGRAAAVRRDRRRP